MTRNMKAFIFTIDAVISLIIASLAVSLLLYVHFTPSNYYQSSSGEASSLMQSLLHVSIGGYSAGSNMPASFGTCGAKPSDSVIAALADMYLNHNGSCADMILNSFYPSGNSGIFINDNFSPSLGIAGFNGINSYAEQDSGYSFLNNATKPFSLSVWFKPSVASGVVVAELGQPSPTGTWNYSTVEMSSGKVYVRLYPLSCIDVGNAIMGHWNNVVLSYTGSGYSGYLNGVLGNSETGTRSVPGGSGGMYYPVGLGTSNNCGSGSFFAGSISNLQIYNSSLAAPQAVSIYRQGEFGSPVTNLSIVGWWPLNGNANDYSGNGNGATTFNVLYGLPNYLPESLSGAYQVSRVSIPMNINVSGTIRHYSVGVVVWH